MSQADRPMAAMVAELTLDMRLKDEKKKRTRSIAASLSGIAFAPGCVFLGSDEGPGIERLRLLGDREYGGREEYRLDALFSLPPDPEVEEEADVESLSIDGDWLWLVTSHALVRDKLDKVGVKAFAKLHRHPRRYVLGRVPLAPGVDGLPTPAAEHGGRRAACVPLLAPAGSALSAALAEDPHLGPSLALPAKENGLDIEGIVAAGDRVVLGLRGPVLRGWAVLLDLAWTDEERGIPLRVRDGLPYRKLFVPLDGLGVRDLGRVGDDLVVLAGPTMPVPAPYRLYRLPRFFRAGSEEQDDGELAAEYLCDVPSAPGENPEGIALHGGEGDFALVHDCAKPDDDMVSTAMVVRVPGR